MAAGKQKKQGEAVETREKTTKKKDPCLGCDLDCTKCEVNGAKTLRRAACKTLRAGVESEDRRCKLRKAFAVADGVASGERRRQEKEAWREIGAGAGGRAGVE